MCRTTSRSQSRPATLMLYPENNLLASTKTATPTAIAANRFGSSTFSPFTFGAPVAQPIISTILQTKRHNSSNTKMKLF